MIRSIFKVDGWYSKIVCVCRLHPCSTLGHWEPNHNIGWAFLCPVHTILVLIFDLSFYCCFHGTTFGFRCVASSVYSDEATSRSPMFITGASSILMIFWLLVAQHSVNSCLVNILYLLSLFQKTWNYFINAVISGFR